MKRILSIILLFIALTLNSQNAKQRPKVALVLSGGTAKGLAHIGVLKVLEEQGIKPDLIVGTSMGSIIGGLYAIGYTADEIEKITLNTDWFKYLSNTTDLRNLNIEEKDDFEEYVYNFPIEKRKPGLGKGIIYGHELELYLNKVLFPAYKYSNFDEFPIEFRAISTDVLNNEVYVFKDGPLPLALRASMSIPNLFEPIRYKGKVLVDGGILDNFGVDIALKENADIIIGSNVERISKSEKDFDTYKNLSAQLMMLHSKQKYKKYKDSVDVLIEPPVIEMGSRFDKAQKIIDIGYQTALTHLDEIKKIKLLLKERKQKKVIHEKSFPISQIAVRGINDLSYKYHIYNRLRNNIGVIATYTAIEKEITDLYRSGQFSYIKYYIEKISDNDYKLLFDFSPKAKNNLQLGIHYTDQVDLGLIVGLTSRNTLSPDTKFKIKARISKYPGVDQHLIKFTKIKNYRFGLKQFFNYSLDKISIYDDYIRLTAYNRHFFDIGASLLTILSRNSILESGYKYEKYFYNKLFRAEYQDIGNATVTKNTVFLSYYYNSLDDKTYAKCGLLVKSNIEYHYKTTVENYQFKNKPSSYFNLSKFNIKLKKFTPLGKKFVLESSVYAEYNLSMDSLKFILYDKIIGGVYPDNNSNIPFWGLPNSYVIPKNYGVTSIGLRYKISDRLYLKSEINAGIVNLSEHYLGGGLSLGFNSPIGPLSIGISLPAQYKTPLFHISMGYFR